MKDTEEDARRKNARKYTENFNMFKNLVEPTEEF